MGDVLRERIKQQRFEGPAQEAMLNVMVAAGHLRQMVDEVCGRHGLTQGQYNVLRILRGAHPAGYPRGEIASRMLERAPDVTRLIDRLERDGLVARVRGEKDRRLSVTQITASGMGILRKLDRPIAEITRDVESRLTAEELRTLSRLCEALYAPGPSATRRTG